MRRDFVTLPFDFVTWWDRQRNWVPLLLAIATAAFVIVAALIGGGK